ncbi:MAG TPA: hypothetical protein VNM67_25915 [Thermoanaerobaculia bacterium]|jgi:hypothetical protein|nr:hypothetical protein [Thermoanaerobaculia bacterium]
MDRDATWLCREDHGWFQSYFSPRDARRRRAPCGPPGSNRGKCKELSNLVTVDPHHLELHLSYSEGLEHGPVILRSGDSPPVMEDPEELGSYTTDPDLQRIGAYYILEAQKPSHLRKIYFLFAGSYILNGSLLGTAEARERAQRLAQNYRPSLSGFPEPDEFHTGTFSFDIVTLAERIRDVLNLACPPAEPLRAEDAIRAVSSVYTKHFEHYLSNFQALKDDRVYRETVDFNMRKYLRLLFKQSEIPSHEQAIQQRGLGDIILMQGCGDLTMNDWNVAFVSGASHPKRQWCLLYPHGEPLNDREYSCLIKWSCRPAELEALARHHRIVYPYQIAKVRFKAPSPALSSLSDRPDRHVFLKEQPIGNLIEFAVYGRQLCRDRELVKLRSVVREFNDLRHVYKLPNLNRRASYDTATASTILRDYAQQPRNLFNRATQDDVWLGEAALAQGDRNLRCAALSQPIQLDLKALGAPEEWIRVVLEGEEKEHTYRFVKDDLTGPGQWRWLSEGRGKWLEIWPLRNQYPCSMIGVRVKESSGRCNLHETEFLHFLAHGHGYDWQGCTIEEAAEFLQDHGTTDALLFDEGFDVFQLVRSPADGALKEKVTLKRDQLRCVFWATSKEA